MQNKSEIRISKPETNSKPEFQNVRNIFSFAFRIWVFWLFEFVSNFGFRASDLIIQIHGPSWFDRDRSFRANFEAAEAADALLVIKNQIFSLSLQGSGWADLCAFVTFFAHLLCHSRFGS